MGTEPESRKYEKPEVVDYGTLVELTAGMGHGHHEDGLHKAEDPSKPHRR